jgi:hypothetical protein
MLTAGAPAGCVACRYPAATHHPQFGPVHEQCVAVAQRAGSWLTVLAAGSLGGCLACRGSTIWHHPVHGPVHPSCVECAMSLLDDGGEPAAPVLVVSSAGLLRRGAYARRAAR